MAEEMLQAAGLRRGELLRALDAPHRCWCSWARASSAGSLCTRRINAGGGPVAFPRRCWTPPLPESVDTNTRNAALGRVARRRSYSSIMCASSSSQVTDARTSSSSARRCLTVRTSAPPATSDDSRAARPRKVAARGTARTRVSPPTYRAAPPGPQRKRRPPWLHVSLMRASASSPDGTHGAAVAMLSGDRAVWEDAGGVRGVGWVFVGQPVLDTRRITRRGES
jgi:hypothetical protein